MKVFRSYEFKYVEWILTKYSEYSIDRKGFMRLTFIDIPSEEIDNVLYRISEHIKHDIKEKYSLKFRGTSCFSAPTFWKEPPKPIELFDFKKYKKYKSPFKDDTTRFCFSYELSVDKEFVDKCDKNNTSKNNLVQFEVE